MTNTRDNIGHCEDCGCPDGAAPHAGGCTNAKPQFPMTPDNHPPTRGEVNTAFSRLTCNCGECLIHSANNPTSNHPALTCTGEMLVHKRISHLEARVRELTKAVDDFKALIDESDGVYGLHLNGDNAPWEELLDGGHYEEWLRSLNEVEALNNDN